MKERDAFWSNLRIEREGRRRRISAVRGRNRGRKEGVEGPEVGKKMYCGGLIVWGEGPGRFGISAEGSSFEFDGVGF